MDSVPKLGQSKANEKLAAIPGQIPPLSDRVMGCVFAPRCSLAIEKCFIERPSLDSVSAEAQVRCHRWPEIAAGTVSAHQKAFTGAGQQTHPNDDKVVLNIKDVKVEFPITRSLTDSVAARARQSIKAVDGISLSIQRGHTLGVVGESGSGKSTLARTVVGLVEPTSGTIELFGLQLPARLSRRERATLRRLQYIFQNPEEALNPYLTIGETLTRPFVTLLGQSSTESRANAQRLLTAVGLPADYSTHLPGQLSGGEKQRVAIARAFAASPALIIADEPVSSLDVSVQAAILKLMGDMQQENNNTMLFISHDLAVVGYLADSIAVFYAGQVMELADAAELFKPPYHPYTEALLSAVPSLDPSATQHPIRLEGDVPSQIDVPAGCRFHPRCPRYLGDICREQTPPWQLTDSGSHILCHIPWPELKAQQKPAASNGGEGRSG
jgi:peptide/nickel transport system ATP-binding protein